MSDIIGQLDERPESLFESKMSMYVSRYVPTFDKYSEFILSIGLWKVEGLISIIGTNNLCIFRS